MKCGGGTCAERADQTGTRPARSSRRQVPAGRQVTVGPVQPRDRHKRATSSGSTMGARLGPRPSALGSSPGTCPLARRGCRSWRAVWCVGPRVRRRAVVWGRRGAVRPGLAVRLVPGELAVVSPCGPAVAVCCGERACKAQAAGRGRALAAWKLVMSRPAAMGSGLARWLGGCFGSPGSVRGLGGGASGRGDNALQQLALALVGPRRWCRLHRCRGPAVLEPGSLGQGRAGERAMQSAVRAAAQVPMGRIWIYLAVPGQSGQSSIHLVIGPDGALVVDTKAYAARVGGPDGAWSTLRRAASSSMDTVRWEASVVLD